MLDKNDLQAIAEMIRTEVRTEITASEERMIAAMDSKIGASEARMEALIKGEIANSEQRTAQKIVASETRLKDFIDIRAREAESRAIAFAENEVTRRQGVIKDGIDLSLQVPRVQPERIVRVEQDIAALKYTVQNHADEIKALKRGA